MINKIEVTTLNEQYINKQPQAVIQYFLDQYPGEIVFSTSLQAEDQVLTDMICKHDKTNVSFVTLDTGRMFEETYDILHRTNMRYKINIKAMFPERDKVEQMTQEKGINLFYESIENRKLCCHIRKTLPLMRAIEGHKIWITGLRRSQSVTRKDIPMIEWDEAHNITKVNPLINWEYDDVWDYIKKNNIPYHKLHDKGFPSIGCEPCTRAVSEGEDIRAGRWWWESPDNKECGLHIDKR
ncbi:MAG: phosphoadenylyl-sulfate reductase [Bacteroidales bacterium]|nr:phosphoadenylyl-sulfate reductase [Bacteroidales bacterium]